MDIQHPGQIHPQNSEKLCEHSHDTCKKMTGDNEEDNFDDGINPVKLAGASCITSIAMMGVSRLLTHTYTNKLTGFDCCYLILGGFVGFCIFSTKDKNKRDKMISDALKGVRDMAVAGSKTKPRLEVGIKSGTINQLCTVVKYDIDHTAT